MGPSLTTAFDRQQAEPPRRRVSSPCFVHSVFGFGCQYITVFIYPPSLPHPLVIPSPGHYSLSTHALSTKCPGQGWGTQRADLGWPWRSTQQRAAQGAERCQLNVPRYTPGTGVLRTSGSLQFLLAFSEPNYVVMFLSEGCKHYSSFFHLYLGIFTAMEVTLPVVSDPWKCFT